MHLVSGQDKEEMGMKRIISKILLLRSRNSVKEVFETKIFNIVTFVGAFTCFFSIIINISITSSSLVNLFIGLIGITFCVFFYFSFFRGIVKPLILPFQILVAAALALSWFYFQGIEGSSPFFFFATLSLLIYSNQEKKYWTILILYVSLAIVLVGTHYVYPEWVIPYPDKNARIIDLSFSFIILLSMLGYGIIVLKKNFDLERSRTEQKNRELHELNATKDKFFSIISHDLKSPFTSIAGFSDILVEQVREKNYEKIEIYATIIQDSSQRVMDLLMNLLEWSRSQTGQMQYQPESVELVGLINQVCELMNDSARQKSITLSLQTPRNVPVIADTSMILCVLRNLISNAIKFTQAGGTVTISLVQKQKEVMVSVSDNGVGIRKELIDKLFRIDQSYSTPGTRNEKGSGLGLILCKDFVEKNGGKIWVESQSGKGSIFSFTIPGSAL